MRPPQARGLALICALLACGQLWGGLPGAAAQPEGAGDARTAGSADGGSPDEAAGFLTPEEAAALLPGPGAGTGVTTQEESGQQYGLAAGPAGEIARLKYAGTAVSAYEATPLASAGAIDLGCGFGFVDEDFRAAYIGVGNDYWGKGFACGRCVRLQCDDAACQPLGARMVVQVVDLCGDCLGANIALSIPAFQNFTAGSDLNTLQVSWEFLPDCSPYVNGTIKMLVKPGGNAYFQAFNFANSLVPIVAAQINGDRLRPGTSNYWEWNPGKAIDPSQPLELALAGATRQVLRLRISQLRSQDLKVQFKPAAVPPPGEPAAAAPAPAQPAPVEAASEPSP
ncbi:Expansin 1 [Micractinium conductrix]|uniref:Expansin 1 n=1 Tax=Micractinium conductrix TaxID=554055 RepID=A0A2P6VFW0_9CHLO|nr:Expansin 1 [Micractinium conductrix]|eukprot:PSC72982.1 Expansin 1 [Micractinium conductrix]